MRLNQYLLLCLFSLSSASLSAAAPLSLDDFLTGILKNNPGMQQILTQEDIASAQMTSSLGISDMIIRSNGTLRHAEPNRITGSEFDHSNELAYDVSIDQINIDTGTRISLGYSQQYAELSTPSPLLGASFSQPSLTLKLTQPLFKNAGGIQDRLNINLSQLDLDLARFEAQEQAESYLTRMTALYLDWYLAYREMEISQGVYEQTKKQEALVKTKLKRQVSEKYELYRVQETREDFYSRWQQAIGRYEGLKAQIGKQINLMLSDRQQWQPIDPAESKVVMAVDVDENYLATDSRLKDIINAIKSRQMELVAARGDSQKPNLDLSVTYNRHGADSQFVDAHSSSLERDDLSLMLAYSFPLGNRAAKGAYQTQIAIERQIAADVAQLLIDAEAALANLNAQEKQTMIALQSSDRKIDLADAKLKEEQHLYQIGQLDLFELLQDQTAQLETRLNRERLYVQLLRLRVSIGELLDRNLTQLTAGDKLPARNIP